MFRALFARARRTASRATSYLRIEYVLFGVSLITKLALGVIMRFSVFTIALASAAFCATAADAQLGKPTVSRPVTAKDLVGKKICWNAGGVTTFGADGHFTNQTGRRFVWFVSQPGVVKLGRVYREYSILPDGSFYQHRFNGGGGSITGHSEWWGKVCN